MNAADGMNYAPKGKAEAVVKPGELDSGWRLVLRKERGMEFYAGLLRNRWLRWIFRPWEIKECFLKDQH